MHWDKDLIMMLPLTNLFNSHNIGLKANVYLCQNLSLHQTN